MSQPLGAPAPTPDTGTPTVPPAPVPPTQPDTGTAGDTTDWKAEAEKYQAFARKQEDRAKANVAAAQQAEQYKKQLDAMLKAGGRNPDGTPAADPEKAAAEQVQRAEQAEALAYTNAARLEIYQTAAELGANANRLLDSIAFLDSLEDLDGDPGTPEFRTALEEKIRDAMGRNPDYKATPATLVAPRSGGALPGGPGAQPERATSLAAAIREDLQRKAR